MATLSELRQREAKLAEAYHSGFLTITVDGVVTTFQKSSDMERALRNLRREIAEIEGVQKRPAAATFDLRGLG